MFGLWSLVVLGACQPASVAEGDPWTPPTAPLNVLFLSVDTLRRDALGRYGGGDDMPVLDAWLDGGLTLDAHASCSSWTVPSMACALTGMDTLDLGFTPIGGDASLAIDAETMAEVFREQHYAATLVTANTYLDDPVGLGKGYRGVVSVGNWRAERVVDRGLEALQELSSGSRPWLLHMHFIDPHTPYQEALTDAALLEELPPVDVDFSDSAQTRALESRWVNLSVSEREVYLSWLRELYRAQNRYLDAELGRLLDALESEGLIDDTVVVFLTDHGEQFDEHQKIFHGKSLYAEELAGVASFRGPGIEPGSIATLTTHADVLPTLLAMTGWPAPEGVTGASVADLDEDRATFGARVYAEGAIQSVRQGGWEMIFQWDGTLELFDAADVGQERDVLAEEPAAARALWGVLEPQVQRLDGLLPDQGPEEPAL